ncbi:MAG TPA: tripartite tricarboxylate transporter substrate binding protein, partial [Geminicoccaceae bacterium]|nr:tripartite tricarboxylate transporter substrate binding protein [Geminicoccaceae bacterium]
VSRAITPHVEPLLGREIVLENKPGATGAISTQYVHARPSDGYTLLYGAENPQLHKVLGVAELDYADFYPVNILARGVGVIVANNDRPWQTFQDLVEDAKARPGAIKMGGTGPGGLPHVVGALLETVTEFEVTTVPFDGEGPGLTALLGGHVDFMPVGVSAAAEHIKAGRVRPLAVVASEELDMLPGVPPITADYPEFGRYLPWGPFYGIFVKRDVPDEAKTKLVAAFKEGAQTPEFQQLMTDSGNVMMNISGDEADEFLKKWQSVTSWLLQDAGAAKVSPEEFGIPRP